MALYFAVLKRSAFTYGLGDDPKWKGYVRVRHQIRVGLRGLNALAAGWTVQSDSAVVQQFHCGSQTRGRQLTLEHEVAPSVRANDSQPTAVNQDNRQATETSSDSPRARWTLVKP